MYHQLREKNVIIKDLQNTRYKKYWFHVFLAIIHYGILFKKKKIINLFVFGLTKKIKTNGHQND